MLVTTLYKKSLQEKPNSDDAENEGGKRL